jgi:hypothetical protein
MKGPYTEIVGDNTAHAEHWARVNYGQVDPKAVEVGGSRDGRKTFRVYDLADENVTSGGE